MVKFITIASALAAAAMASARVIAPAAAPVEARTFNSTAEAVESHVTEKRDVYGSGTLFPVC